MQVKAELVVTTDNPARSCVSTSAQAHESVRRRLHQEDPQDERGSGEHRGEAGRRRQGHSRGRRERRHPDQAIRTLGIQSTEQSRRAYREMLFTTSGVAEFISGAILYDETIRQKSSDGTPLAQVLSRQGIVPGIKVDTGAEPLAGFPEETVTEGLDGLRDRLAEYHGIGARFAKWRAVIRITDNVAEPGMRERERPRPRALCRAVSGGAARADRRAGSADERRPSDRALRGGHR